MRGCSCASLRTRAERTPSCTREGKKPAHTLQAILKTADECVLVILPMPKVKLVAWIKSGALGEEPRCLISLRGKRKLVDACLLRRDANVRILKGFSTATFYCKTY